ncbi:MAG: NYN domain-containing protein [Candidatus Omnitrophota bacterium]|nr:NYN domain-containing protein [Candidatus Omnitrophota bacterium]MBU1894332.1 NYN domain-containing protein [Candidatus Omnitrophota bacterium]
MKTTMVVDAYNAIYAIPRVRKELSKDLESARKAVIDISKKYAASSGYITEVRVVFDGDSKYKCAETFDVADKDIQIFSETGKGDEKIIETVRRYSRFGRVVLVSNDNYVRNNARGYNASVISPEELVKKPLNRGSIPKEKSLNKRIGTRLEKQITNEYMRELGLE